MFSCRRGPARCGGAGPCPSTLPAGTGLPAEAELLPQGAVALDVLALQVLQQPTAAVVVVGVHLEVLGQVVDPPGQQRDLDFRRTGVTLIGRVPGDDLFLHRGIQRHVVSSSSRTARSHWPAAVGRRARAGGGGSYLRMPPGVASRTEGTADRGQKLATGKDSTHRPPVRTRSLRDRYFRAQAGRACWRVQL